MAIEGQSLRDSIAYSSVPLVFLVFCNLVVTAVSSSALWHYVDKHWFYGGCSRTQNSC